MICNPVPIEDFPKTEVVAGRNDDESDKSILEHGERGPKEAGGKEQTRCLMAKSSIFDGHIKHNVCFLVSFSTVFFSGG